MQVKIVSVLFAVGALIAPAFACLPAGHACTIGAANDCCFSADCEPHPGHENPGAIGACGH
ncbi:hypothetical protein CH063_07939 [Colletotrichum higginsianum]|uniref:Uncharacterized protein n=1 Tax=Colletotrichum higginsianum (strain IMI 349063) TaxID=759273 RepID=H1V7Z9_COLHI|nr:hypothetical protein CH063_07939 [Colletotrichum higginsianum]